jgi:hypothetical protein
MTTPRLLACSALVLLALSTTGCKRARFKSRSLASPSPGSARFAKGLAQFGDELPSSFGRSDDGDRAALFEALRAETERQRELESVTRELRTALESAVERHCVTVSSDALYLEPQGQALQRLFRSVRTLTAPADVRLPAAGSVMGLPVHVMHVGEEARWCADQDEALVGRVVRRAAKPAKADVQTLARGAWLVRTRPGPTVPASASLVSREFLESLGVKGALVAFAPTDHAVAYADASSREALTAAAKAITANLDASGDEGVLQAQPLVWADGVWHAWTPKSLSPEAKSAVAAALELETSMAAGLVEDLVDLTLALTLTPELKKVAVQVPDAVATSRSRTSNGKVSVRVETGLPEAQLVGLAQVVEVVNAEGRATQVPWPDFEVRALRQGRLSPALVDGVKVPRLYQLAPDFEWQPRVD